MMNDGPVQMFADKLKPGGEFRFGTDHPVYVRHALMVMRRFIGPGGPFEWVTDGPDSFRQRPSGWPETRYEHKARTVYGHEVWYFRFRRR
jgi:tRNA (guanine-N7-)-methyltransferase